MLCMCNDIVMTFLKKEWFKNLRHCSFPFTMVFLVKRPPELPRALCASHCPPHNVLHNMSDFPLYYDPLYYPTCFLSIFNSPIKVYEWLLTGSQTKLILIITAQFRTLC